jgi:hypothetical protein
VFKALEALKEAYKSDVRGINEKYMESKRRWRYSLSQAVAHRHMPEEATRFEAEATMWRRQWEGASPELVEAARKVKNDHAPKASRTLLLLACLLANATSLTPRRSRRYSRRTCRRS